MIKALRQEGYQLLHHGLIALAKVEANGIRIDTELLKESQEDLRNKVRKLKSEIEQTKLWSVWRRRYADKSNLGSLAQLGEILHGHYGFEIVNVTETGRPKMDEEALQNIDHPVVKKYARFLKYSKALNTFLKGIASEVVDGRLHPMFNLHTARSFRSSSEAPNFQNFPVRDKEISQIIRKHFIASPKSVIVENDFKGIEVCVSAAYHKDKNFISYITTPGKDMHRDMAAQIYCLPPKEVDKDTRYGAKNKFVFPQFYGDFYVSCARSLWDWIEKGKLKTKDGIPLKQHLKENGIRSIGKCDPEEEAVKGTFEHHLKIVEDDFWNHRFRDYGRWKRKWYDSYLEKGYFDLMTGFRIEGVFRRNQVINLPVQGSAFHCLLWCLIHILRLMEKYRFRSKVVGQIHDSLVGDIREDELRDYLEIVEDVTTHRLPKHYPWLVVSPPIEYELSPPGHSWFDKKEFKFKNGCFLHPRDITRTTTNEQKFFKTLTV